VFYLLSCHRKKPQTCGRPFCLAFCISKIIHWACTRTFTALCPGITFFGTPQNNNTEIHLKFSCWHPPVGRALPSSSSSTHRTEACRRRLCTIKTWFSERSKRRNSTAADCESKTTDDTQALYRLTDWALNRKQAADGRTEIRGIRKCDMYVVAKETLVQTHKKIHRGVCDGERAPPLPPLLP